MMKFHTVIVEWDDASHYGDTNDIEYLKKRASPVRNSTIGFLLKSSRKQIVLTHEVDEGGRARNTSVIPRGLIRRITYLEDHDASRE